MNVTILAFAIAMFFAMNIGASGAAATMGIAYGSGAVRKKQLALFISGVGVFLGASIGGGEVVKTIGSGIIPSSILDVNIVLVILGAATVTLFTANVIGIPLSTSEVAVGSIVGVGIAFQAVFVEKLLIIVMYWILIPLIAFFLSFVIGRCMKKIGGKLDYLTTHKWARPMAWLVIITGFLEAFSAGMNNVANSVGPLVGAGLIPVTSGTIIGGVFVAIGAIFLGGRVIETNGKKITDLSLLEGSTVSGLGATLVIIASILGIPIPQTQVTTCSILGIGMAKNGPEMLGNGVVKKIARVWLISPILSLILSYSFVKIFMKFDFYSAVIVVFVFLATIGSISLFKVVKNEEESSGYEKKKRDIKPQEEKYGFVAAARRYFSQSDSL